MVLVSRLDDQLYDLNERGVGSFPRAAAAYLTEWTANGWLRKYYPPGEGEVHFDATSALEKAVAWVRGLPARSFVGTESQLNTIVALLRQMAFGAETDPQARIDELSWERDAIDTQIAQLRASEVDMLSPLALLDRYQQVETTAVELLQRLRSARWTVHGRPPLVRRCVGGPWCVGSGWGGRGRADAEVAPGAGLTSRRPPVPKLGASPQVRGRLLPARQRWRMPLRRPPCPTR